MATVPIRHRAGAELPVVAARTVRKVIRKDEDFTIAPRSPTTSRARSSPATRSAGRSSSCAGETVATVPLTAALAVPAAGAGRQTQDFLTQPWLLVILGVVLAARDARHPPPVAGPPGAGGAVIITVTLNSAIDKTMAVPNFQPGRRHRTVDQTTTPAARASTSRGRSSGSASRSSRPASRAGRRARGSSSS